MLSGQNATVYRPINPWSRTLVPVNLLHPCKQILSVDDITRRTRMQAESDCPNLSGLDLVHRFSRIGPVDICFLKVLAPTKISRSDFTLKNNWLQRCSFWGDISLGSPVFCHFFLA